MQTDNDSDFSADDLRRGDWQELIANHPTKQCFSYAAPLLADIAPSNPDCSSPGNPYAPAWRPDKQFPEAGLDVLDAVLDEIRDPELRARVGDILWEYSATLVRE